MKLHEYQAKEVFARWGVAVPANAGVIVEAAEAAAAVERLGGAGVLKAQVHTGGRGKAGGIRVVHSASEAVEVAGQLLGMLLKTKQAPDGLRIDRLLIEAPIEITSEYYLGIVPDRTTRHNVVMLSAKGGMDIEQVAEETPEAIVKVDVDPLVGLCEFALRDAAYRAGLNRAAVNRIVTLGAQLYKCFTAMDGALVEVNPLAITADGAVVAADAKFEVDDSALFRHPELAQWAESAEEDPIEAEAHKQDIAYVHLGGDIGIICNGAGLTMTTMDEVKRAGGSPANFLDVGGGAQAERVRSCINLVMSDTNVRGILINIFGGITRCDEVAHGILSAIDGVELKLPIVVRLAGTRAEEGAAILKGSRLIPMATMEEAAARIVALSR
ncbi:MAG: ADP-forming succinate--CoA ligase subunit beta [Armatimonadetes bacterium]|nr:ADP-forming succinate--CoA ligase subunit beta [Armatimonadota bacterium]MDE2205202.1 ADP-forming succinate--CoA ligase subunit beta [Armatimonadota bacterium]